MMFISIDRILYCGLLGIRSAAALGSITLHVSLGNPFLIRIDKGAWFETRSALIQPNVSHQLKSADELIATLCVEPEYVDCAAIPWMQANAEAALNRVAERIQSVYARVVHENIHDISSPFDLNKALFDGTLPNRRLDPRIESTIDRMRINPYAQISAEECADNSGLSFSRFLHLFRHEVGISFRRFRAWKRARGILQHVNLDANLTDIALAAGYPDATHFSHSIRRIYGMKPKDMFAGSRRLAVLS